MREEDDNNDAELSQDERTEEFLHLLNKHERTLSVYVTGLVQPLQDAQDILQDGKIVMWRNFGNFTEGTNFLAWARKILLHQILPIAGGPKSISTRNSMRTSCSCWMLRWIPRCWRKMDQP